VIIANMDRTLPDFGGKVAIAEVPGDTSQRTLILQVIAADVLLPLPATMRHPIT
jgi:hypothetical protein